MKKILLACLALTMGLLLCACSNSQSPTDTEAPEPTGILESAAVEEHDGEFSKIHYFAEENALESYYVWCDSDMTSVEILSVGYQDDLGLVEQAKLRTFDSISTGEAIQLNINVPEGTPNLAIRYEANGTVRTYAPSYNGRDGGMYLTEADVAPAQKQGESGAESDAGADGEAIDPSQEDEGFLCAVYVVNSNADGLIRTEVTIESSSAWHIWAALKKANSSIPLAAGLNSYAVAQGVGIFDVEADIYSMNAGSSVEALILQAIANTYIENTDATTLMIRVDGGTYESGHIILDEPIVFQEPQR